jgi:hypothetical protein
LVERGRAPWRLSWSGRWTLSLYFCPSGQERCRGVGQRRALQGQVVGSGERARGRGGAKSRARTGACVGQKTGAGDWLGSTQRGRERRGARARGRRRGGDRLGERICWMNLIQWYGCGIGMEYIPHFFYAIINYRGSNLFIFLQFENLVFLPKSKCSFGFYHIISWPLLII